MLNLKEIEAFRAVMLHGTVTAAAVALRVSQPAISRLISQLERRLSIKLFQRQKQRLQTTREGFAFFREVEKSFHGLDKLQRAADNIRNYIDGDLKIISLPAMGLGFLPHVVARFRKAHPTVHITLQTRSSNTVLDWMSAAAFDIAIASGRIEREDLVAEPFTDAPGVCVVPTGHKLARKAKITPADLHGQAFISLDPADPTRAAIDNMFRDHGTSPNVVVETPYAAVACALVQQKVGIAIVNRYTAADYRRFGLSVVPLSVDVRFRTSLVRNKGVAPSRLAERFLASMRETRDLYDRQYARP